MSQRQVPVSLPEDIVMEIDAAAEREKRTRSELIQEALRIYLAREEDFSGSEPLPDEIEAVKRAEEEFARGEFVRLEDLQRELGLDPQQIR